MNYEKNLSTEQDQEKTFSRFPCENGDKRWTQGPSPQKTERQMATHCIDFSFKKSMHVRKRWEFAKIRRLGHKFYGKHICFQFTVDTTGPSKLGLTVSRKYGSAIERNLFKRRMREFFRLQNSSFPENINLNILPLLHTKKASFDQLKEDWGAFIAYLNKGSDENRF